MAHRGILKSPHLVWGLMLQVEPDFDILKAKTVSGFDNLWIPIATFFTHKIGNRRFPKILLLKYYLLNAYIHFSISLVEKIFLILWDYTELDEVLHNHFCFVRVVIRGLLVLPLKFNCNKE